MLFKATNITDWLDIQVIKHIEFVIEMNGKTRDYSFVNY